MLPKTLREDVSTDASRKLELAAFYNLSFYHWYSFNFIVYTNIGRSEGQLAYLAALT